MKLQSKIGAILLTVVVVCIGYFYVYKRNSSEYTFLCKGEKSIVATFFPKEDTHVTLKLSDGRSLSLPHAVSGSGARYANTDESVVFWNKGDTAFIEEKNTTTFEDCVLKK